MISVLQCEHICFKLLISLTLGQAASLHSEAENIRRLCTDFLHYVKVFIFRWDLCTIYIFNKLCVNVPYPYSHCISVCLLRYLEPPKMESVGVLHPYEELEAQFPSVLVEELHSLTQHIGHLCELPSSVLAAFTIQHQAKVGGFYSCKFIF